MLYTPEVDGSGLYSLPERLIAEASGQIDVDCRRHQRHRLGCGQAVIAHTTLMPLSRSTCTPYAPQLNPAEYLSCDVFIEYTETTHPQPSQLEQRECSRINSRSYPIE